MGVFLCRAKQFFWQFTINCAVIQQNEAVQFADCFWEVFLRKQSCSSLFCFSVGMVAKRPGASFPSPKRGMLRLVLRRPASKKRKAAERPPRDSVSYVPPEQVIDSKQLAELRVQAWRASLLTLMQLTELALIKHLLKIGMLQNFACCPHCKCGKLSPLRKDKTRGYVQRCRAKACQKFVLPRQGLGKLTYPIMSAGFRALLQRCQNRPGKNTFDHWARATRRRVSVC